MKEKDLEHVLLTQPLGGTNPAKMINFCVSLPVGGTLSQQPQQSNTPETNCLEWNMYLQMSVYICWLYLIVQVTIILVFYKNKKKHDFPKSIFLKCQAVKDTTLCRNPRVGQQPYRVDTIINSILEMKTLRHREFAKTSKEHPTSKWQSRFQT